MLEKNDNLIDFNVKLIANLELAGNQLQEFEQTKLESNVFDNLDSENYFIVDLVGDSMANANLFDKDLLVFQREKSVSRGQNKICLVNVNGKQFVKWLRYYNFNIYLHSDNPNYEPYKLKKTDNFEVLGVLRGKFQNIFH